MLHTRSIGNLPLCQIIELVTFGRCAFVIALMNIALGGILIHVETFRTLILLHDVWPEMHIIITIII